MSKNRDMKHDREETKILILNPNRKKYAGGKNWLGHGIRGENNAFVDEMLIDGATMHEMLKQRGAINEHFGHLRVDHGLLYEEIGDIYRFSLSDLGISASDLARSQGKITERENEAAKRRAVRRMVKTAKDTVAGADGQQVSQKVKEKENRFATDEDFDKYVTELLSAQNGLCAITGLVLQFDDQVDDQELLVSLDRIDSDGHYEPGNLQLVCRFVNRWKSDGNDAEFRRLMGLVRNS